MTSAVIAGPPTVHEPSSPTAPGRRRRRRVAWALLVVVLVGLIGAGWWFAAYQPVELQGGFSGTVGPAVETIDNSYGTDYRVLDPEPGDELVLIFGIRNLGPLEVTITHIGQPFNPAGTVGDPSHPDETSAGRLTFAFDPAGQEFVERQAVTLVPDGFVQARLAFDVLDCATVRNPHRISSITSVPVTYRVLGMSRTVQLDLGYAFSIQGLPRCP